MVEEKYQLPTLLSQDFNYRFFNLNVSPILILKFKLDVSRISSVLLMDRITEGQNLGGTELWTDGWMDRWTGATKTTLHHFIFC